MVQQLLASTDLCRVVDELVVLHDTDDLLQLKDLGRIAHPRVVDAVGRVRPEAGGGYRRSVSGWRHPRLDVLSETIGLYNS